MKSKRLCPHCQAELEFIGFRKLYLRHCEVELLEDNNLNFAYNEDDDEGTFYCYSCGKDLDLTEEEVIDILRSFKEEGKSKLE